MAKLLANKVIAITGCSAGIGRATALECTKQGARLVLHHIGDQQSKRDIETLKEEIKSLNGESVDIAADVRDLAAGQGIVDTAVSSFGEINGLVNNAGICTFDEFTTITPEMRDLHMAVNYAGPFSITQAVTKELIRRGKGGSIVSIGSITATLGSSTLCHYSSTKAAVQGMTVSCAVALGKYGIRLNTVNPGTIETAINREELNGPKRGYMESRVPLGRLGRPDDIAKPVVFFLSDLAQYVSGQHLIVDGGAAVNYQ